MTGTAPQIEWYIGREGQRHGPISDDEMRKFVELGHLRPTDLVWCQSFTEWKPASQVFPREAAPPTAAAPPAAQAQQPQPSTQVQPSPVQPSPVQPSPVQPAPVTTTQPATRPSPAAGEQQSPAPVAAPVDAVTAPQRPRPAPAAQGQSNQPSPAAASSPLSDEAAWAEAMRSVLQPTAPKPAAGPGQSAGEHTLQPSTQPAPKPHTPTPSPAQHQPAQQHHSAQAADAGTARPYAPIHSSPQPVPAPRSSQPDPAWEPASAPSVDSGEPPRKRRDWIALSAGAVAVILVICGLAWITWQNRSLVSGASAIGSAIKATVSSTPSAESYRLSPYDAPGETRDAIDAALQRTAIWRILKRDHAQWYAERVADIEQRRAQKVDEKMISKFMADVIVTLRRNNALAALQSSPEHMRQMARTFGDNLRQLASRDGSTCFAFITFGEANQYSHELARTPAFAETLQRQMVAIFEAIANGKAARQIHPNTRRADYDQLTKELTNRGWSQNDLATFSDPSRLSASPPEKVCTLVQEWFATHLALTDTDLQSRLLAESLKPLVGG